MFLSSHPSAFHMDGAMLDGAIITHHFFRKTFDVKHETSSESPIFEMVNHALYSFVIR